MLRNRARMAYTGRSRPIAGDDEGNGIHTCPLRDMERRDQGRTVGRCCRKSSPQPAKCQPLETSANGITWHPGREDGGMRVDAIGQRMTFEKGKLERSPNDVRANPGFDGACPRWSPDRFAWRPEMLERSRPDHRESPATINEPKWRSGVSPTG